MGRDRSVDVVRRLPGPGPALRLREQIWRPQFAVAERHLYNLLIRLSTELAGRSGLLGLPMADGLIYPYRMTLLVGLLSVLAIWPKPPEGDKREFELLWRFCEAHRAEMKAWGEGAVPCVVALSWHMRLHDSTPRPDLLSAGSRHFRCCIQRSKERAPVANAVLQIWPTCSLIYSAPRISLCGDVGGGILFA